MRLLKLLAYALLGYVLYELYLGMAESDHGNGNGGGEQREAGRGQGQRSRAGARGRRAGTRVQVEDTEGASRSETVGRGVTGA